jgi:hypothetical protein
MNFEHMAQGIDNVDFSGFEGRLATPNKEPGRTSDVTQKGHTQGSLTPRDVDLQGILRRKLEFAKLSAERM